MLGTGDMTFLPCSQWTVNFKQFMHKMGWSCFPVWNENILIDHLADCGHSWLMRHSHTMDVRQSVTFDTFSRNFKMTLQIFVIAITVISSFNMDLSGPSCQSVFCVLSQIIHVILCPVCPVAKRTKAIASLFFACWHTYKHIYVLLIISNCGEVFDAASQQKQETTIYHWWIWWNN